MQWKYPGALAAAFALGGCASFPAGRGLNETHQLISDRGFSTAPATGARDCAAATEELAKLTAPPLTADAAVQIALICNADLAADYARLGIARADAFQAARLANPTLTAAVLDSSVRTAPPQVELGPAQNFTNLLLRGAKKRFAEGEFLRAQQLLAGDVLRMGAETKADYYALVSAQQAGGIRRVIADAMQTSFDLAKRFSEAGNLPARVQAEYGAELAEAQIAVRRADDAIAQARARLESRLGIPSSIPWTVPDQLPVPVKAEDETSALQARAMQNRLDLAAATEFVALLAASEEAARKYRWLGDFELGVSYERDPDRSRLLGPSLSIQLPIFDQGQGAVARAGALRDWGDAERRRLTQAVGTDVRLTAQRVLNARARIDDFRGQLIPQRQALVARTQEEVNFMLTGVFELIAARRAEFDAYLGYLESLRDYWIARAELERAVGANLPSDANRATDTISVQQLLTPPAAMGMHHHDGMDMPGMNMDSEAGNHRQHQGHPGKPNAPKPHADHEHHDMPGMQMPATEQHPHDQPGEQP